MLNSCEKNCSILCGTKNTWGEVYWKKKKKKLHRGGCLKFKAIYQSKSFLFFEKKKKKSEESIKD